MLKNKKKFLFIALFFSLVSPFLYGQDTVEIKIKLVDVDRDKLIIHVNDGITLYYIEDQPKDSIITVRKTNNTIFPRLTIGDKGSNFFATYFVNDSLSSLTLYGNRSDSTLHDGDIVNLTSVLDTASNEIYRKLQNEQMVESQIFGELYNRYMHGGRDNDSLKNEFFHAVKQRNRKSSSFLRPYAHDFFSFFYFSDQIMTSLLFIENDAQYCNELLTYFESVFPKKFKETLEGQKIVTVLEQKIADYVLGENKTFPNLNMNDIHGNAIALTNIKEDFLFIDFWASWCGPCLQQLPQVKALREEFSEDRLKILSISLDRDSLAFTNARLEHNINWTHVLDRGQLLSAKLGVESIPAVVILDRNRRIVYYHVGSTLDIDRIRKILRAKDIPYNASTE